MEHNQRREVLDRLEAELDKEIATGQWSTWEPGKKWRIIATVSQWLTTENAYFMDYALEMVLRWDVPISPTIKIETLRAAYARRDGSSKGTWKQVRRWEWEPRIYQLIANLTNQGFSLSDAAEKAASWVDEASGGDYYIKASTLEKNYSKQVRATGVENKFHDLHQTLNADRLEDWAKSWHDTAAAIPPLSDFRRGVRR